MAFGLGQAVITFGSNEKDLKRGLLSVDKSMQTFKKSAQNVARIARRTLLIGGAVVALFIKQAAEQERAEKALTAALGFRSQKLMDLASAQQLVTTFGDEETLMAQALLASFTKSEKAVAKLTESTQDLAVGAFQGQLIPAANMVAKTIGSSVNALSRYGIEVDGAAGSTARLDSLVRGIADKFGGRARADAETFAGKIKQLKNEIGDAGEEIGSIFIPEMDTLRKSIVEMIPVIRKWISENKELIFAMVTTAAKIAGVSLAINILFSKVNIIAGAIILLTAHFNDLKVGGESLGTVMLDLADRFGIVENAAIRMARTQRGLATITEELARTQQMLDRTTGLESRVRLTEKLLALTTQEARLAIERTPPSQQQASDVQRGKDELRFRQEARKAGRGVRTKNIRGEDTLVLSGDRGSDNFSENLREIFRLQQEIPRQEAILARLREGETIQNKKRAEAIRAVREQLERLRQELEQRPPAEAPAGAGAAAGAAPATPEIIPQQRSSLLEFRPQKFGGRGLGDFIQSQALTPQVKAQQAQIIAVRANTEAANANAVAVAANTAAAVALAGRLDGAGGAGNVFGVS